jgi:DNA-binding transcriptional LysR family regulator
MKRKLIMETRFLDSFVTIAECGSMAEAARRLNVTPTALAQRVRVLEDELHVKLIERSGRTVQLTEGGARVLARAASSAKYVNSRRRRPKMRLPANCAWARFRRR